MNLGELQNHMLTPNSLPNFSSDAKPSLEVTQIYLLFPRPLHLSSPLPSGIRNPSSHPLPCSFPCPPLLLLLPPPSPPQYYNCSPSPIPLLCLPRPAKRGFHSGVPLPFHPFIFSLSSLMYDKDSIYCIIQYGVRQHGN